MDVNNVSKCCPGEFPKTEMKTSTQISFPYFPARTIMYDKLPLGNMPKVRVDPSTKARTSFNYSENIKSTYNESYKVLHRKDVNVENSKLLKRPREYSKVGRHCKPITFGVTEYGREYTMKSTHPNSQGISVEKTSTCPLDLSGRDERDSLPLMSNYSKYLDIYLSTTRATHRAFTLQEQKTLAAKNIVTSQETMDVPKARGFGCKYPEFSGQDLENRDKNMIDKVLFSSEHKLRYMPRRTPKVPNFGSESETQSAYRRPTGVAMAHLFDRFIDFPTTITAPTAKQILSVPGMYTTESYAINRHTSPQIVI